MRKTLNPITWLILLIFFFTMIFQPDLKSHFIWLFFILLILSIILNISLKKIFMRIRYILIFLPILFLFYFTISLLLTEQPFLEIIQTVSISVIRIILMVFAMSLFLEINGSMEILDSLRTLWIKTKIPSRKVEDFFQLLYLTFRFFPLLREEVQTISSFSKTLNLPSDLGRLKQIKRTALYLPGLIFNCLHRADNLALSMEARGYGRVLPRGLLHPIEFRWQDALVLICVFFFILGLSTLA